MNRRFLIYLFTLFVLLPVFSMADSEPNLNPPVGIFSEAERLDIAETVFRYQIQEHTSPSWTVFPIFLVLFTKDPSAEFLGRFEGGERKIKSRSELRDGDFGLILSVDSIEATSRTQAKVHAGYHSDLLAGGGSIYYVEKKDGKWIVTRFQDIWVS